MESNKEKIIKVGAKMFLEKGYNGTGVQEIIKETNLSKGSFYYYFKSKSDLAIAVNEYNQELKEKDFQRAFMEDNWDGFIDNLIENLEEKFRLGQLKGCPFGIMGMEMSLCDHNVAENNYKSILMMEEYFYNLAISLGKDRVKAREMASKSIILYQGSLLMFRLSQDPKYIEDLKLNLKLIGETI